MLRLPVSVRWALAVLALAGFFVAGGCADGDCDKLEGPSISADGSKLQFCIPGGSPEKGSVDSFLYCTLPSPSPFTDASLTLLSHDRSQVVDIFLADGTRAIVGSGVRGRTVTLAAADGALTAVVHTTDHVTPTGRFEHTCQTAYDALGRVDGIIYGDMSLTPQVQIFYTDAGRPDLVDLFSYDFGTSYFYSYDDRLLCTREEIHFEDWDTCAFDEFALLRSYDACRRGKGMHVGYDGVDDAQLMRTYDAENRVAGYALTNAAGHAVSVSFAYDGSRTTGLTYTIGGTRPATFTLALTRDAGRPELVTRRDYAFNGSPVYWYETSYDVLGRPTGANDGGDCKCSRFAGRVGTPCRPRRSRGDRPTRFGNCRYGYTYDMIGNRLTATENATMLTYTANALNQYTSIASTTRIGDRCLTPVANQFVPGSRF